MFKRQNLHHGGDQGLARGMFVVSLLRFKSTCGACDMHQPLSRQQIHHQIRVAPFCGVKMHHWMKGARWAAAAAPEHHNQSLFSSHALFCSTHNKGWSSLVECSIRRRRKRTLRMGSRYYFKVSLLAGALYRQFATDHIVTVVKMKFALYTWNFA
jgi:hypothetical protein